MSENIDKKKKKYPLIGVRIDHETNARLEKESENLKTSKSAIIKQAIKQWFYLIRPADEFERMIIYKNVFGYCLDHLNEEALQELSNLVMKNTYRKDPPNLARKQLVEEYSNLSNEQIAEAFKEYFLQARGLGRGWYKVTKIEYIETHSSFYVELTHRISEKFSEFLYINLQDMVKGYTNFNVNFFDPFIGDTKLSFFFNIEDPPKINQEKMKND